MNMLFKHDIVDKQHYTADEFIAFINLPENEGKTFELIEGYIFMQAENSTGNHQRITGHIFAEIHHYLKGKPCEVFQDLNVFLFKEDKGKCENVFQPDIMVNYDRNKITDQGCEGTPEFVVEVISKSTAKNDYHAKYFYYMEYGVKEYWIVDMYKNQILVFVNDGDGIPFVNRYTFDDKVTVGIFEDFSIDFKELLKIIS